MRRCSKRPAGSSRSAIRPSWSYAARRATTARTPDYAKRWATSGGGALLRLGVHPIGAALQLKRWEGQLRQGRPIRAAAVTAEVATLTDIGGVPARRGVVARHRLGRRGELVHHDHPLRGRLARRLHRLRQHPRRHRQLPGADAGARPHQVQHDAQQYVRGLRRRRHGLGRRVHHREDSDQRRLDVSQPRRGLGARLSARAGRFRRRHP